MSIRLWHGLTVLGDGAVLLPCALLLLLWLLAARETRRTGWLWLLAVLITAGGVALSKVLYMGWGLHPPGLDFIGLSGHAALACLFWPVAGALVTSRSRPSLRALMTVLGACLAIVIMVSRIVLHDHSFSEVILGGLWGALLAALFLLLIWRYPCEAAVTRKWMTVSVLLLLLVILASGRKFPSNRILGWVALRASGHTVIYTRCDLGALDQVKEPNGNCHGRVLLKARSSHAY